MQSSVIVMNEIQNIHSLELEFQAELDNLSQPFLLMENQLEKDFDIKIKARSPY